MIDFSTIQILLKEDDGYRKYGPDIDLDQKWDNYTKLRWHAAVTNAYCDHKIEVRVAPSNYTVEGKVQLGYYSVDLGSSHSGPMTYQGAWKHIYGIQRGAQAMGASLDLRELV